ncbi:MAG: tripartite tricarboxylate transporter substrate binding protein [Burkholderiaceae bacterium]
MKSPIWNPDGSLPRLIVFAIGMLFFASANAQDLKIIAPFSPGGNIDLTARIVAKGLGSRSNRNVIVENKPGAGGMIGGNLVAKSKPDGTTLLLASPSSIFGGPILQGSKASYRVSDLTPVGAVTSTPLLVVVKSDSEFKTLADLVNAARSVRSLSFAHPGEGTINQIAIIKLGEELGVDLVSVPFKGSIDGLQEVMAGRVDVSIAEITVSRQFLLADRLRALAVIADARIGAMPEVPTLKEQGIRTVEANIYTALMAPSGTPDAVLNQLNQALSDVLDDAETQASFAQLGVEPMRMSRPQFVQQIRRDADRFKTMVDKGQIRTQ